MIRVYLENQVFAMPPCVNCGDNSCHWDLVGGAPFCPSCLEDVAMGEDCGALTIRSSPAHCVICGQRGTIPFASFPRNWNRPIEFDLCGYHARSVIARALGPQAVGKLRIVLCGMGIDPESIFLLHDAFYDKHGVALQKAIEGVQ